MANSRYEYVKQYEQDATLLPGCFIVVRVDGKGFTKFSELHGFEKPNDKRALDLMDRCACEVLREFSDVRMGYGVSDEYSFVLAPSTALYGRRTSKIVSVLTSFFTASYVRWWGEHMGADAPLRATPAFDGRAVCYPNAATLRDYLSWRQADCHINNQYNTPYWCLVKSGATPSEAQRTLAGSDAGFKNELLFSRFGINYNELPEQFRKGSVVVRARERFVAKVREDGTAVERERGRVAVLHADIIGDAFWTERPETLAP
ncbi:tRNA(His) guanylyltransferase [Raphidocelis subcapitata]|uniref:tRNA(His) guanylyltransferase n=1 Tax=Raphidocelis subcapitata TaxID=307507 RepID=A0A2V0P3H5_9CHLO|nr:tRNA(His) guanylyltransferase [Raphidocelis subcapitata]|eukprot:GBF94414.1 tRNA(His) guanylyltransferase [Raphidocelis subcapitata]